MKCKWLPHVALLSLAFSWGCGPFDLRKFGRSPSQLPGEDPTLPPSPEFPLVMCDFDIRAGDLDIGKVLSQNGPLEFPTNTNGFDDADDFTRFQFALQSSWTLTTPPRVCMIGNFFVTTNDDIPTPAVITTPMLLLGQTGSVVGFENFLNSGIALQNVALRVSFSRVTLQNLTLITHGDRGSKLMIDNSEVDLISNLRLSGGMTDGIYLAGIASPPVIRKISHDTIIEAGPFNTGIRLQNGSIGEIENTSIQSGMRGIRLEARTSIDLLSRVRIESGRMSSVGWGIDMDQGLSRIGEMNNVQIETFHQDSIGIKVFGSRIDRIMNTSIVTSGRTSPGLFIANASIGILKKVKIFTMGNDSPGVHFKNQHGSFVPGAIESVETLVTVTEGLRSHGVEFYDAGSIGTMEKSFIIRSSNARSWAHGIVFFNLQSYFDSSDVRNIHDIYICSQMGGVPWESSGGTTLSDGGVLPERHIAYRPHEIGPWGASTFPISHMPDANPLHDQGIWIGGICPTVVTESHTTSSIPE